MVQQSENDKIRTDCRDTFLDSPKKKENEKEKIVIIMSFSPLDATFVFCMTRNCGRTETASRYTQKAQKILFTKWCDVDGWIAKANRAQGTTCNPIEEQKTTLNRKEKAKHKLHG